jgi:5-methyltetrahydrofolate--homocysteine methyltransferase
MTIKALLERVRILDGAMGTMLQEKGMPLGIAADAWNIENPEAVCAVHAAYLAAGADMLYANSFGCNALRQKHGQYPIEALVGAALKNARRVAGVLPVALDIGPLGALIEPFGDLEYEEAVALFAEPIQAGKGADCIVIETMMDLGEAEAAVRAARQYGGGLPVLCSFSLDAKGRLLTGADIPAICAAMESAGADAIGCNCGLGPEQLLSLMPVFLAHTRLPLLMKPNAGLPIVRDGVAVYDMPPARFASAMRALLDAGARMLGGCCGTSPAHIEALKDALTD